MQTQTVRENTYKYFFKKSQNEEPKHSEQGHCGYTQVDLFSRDNVEYIDWDSLLQKILKEMEQTSESEYERILSQSKSLKVARFLLTDTVTPMVRQRFQILATQWREENALTSSVAEMAMHPAYQQIIGLGPAAIPLILKELEREPDHWFWALRSITGENPVLPEDAGRMQKMVASWLEWGRLRGYI